MYVCVHMQMIGRVFRGHGKVGVAIFIHVKFKQS